MKGTCIYEGNLHLRRELVFKNGIIQNPKSNRYAAVLLVGPLLARILDFGSWILDHYVAACFCASFGSYIR